MSKHADDHFESALHDSGNTNQVLIKFKEYLDYLDKIDKLLPEKISETRRLRKKMYVYTVRLNKKSTCTIL